MMVKTDVLLLTSHVMVSYTKLEGFRGGGLTLLPSHIPYYFTEMICLRFHMAFLRHLLTNIGSFVKFLLIWAIFNLNYLATLQQKWPKFLELQNFVKHNGSGQIERLAKCGFSQKFEMFGIFDRFSDLKILLFRSQIPPPPICTQSNVCMTRDICSYHY